MRREPQDFEVYEENAPVLEFFLRLQTQWRISPMGQRVGLDYQGVLAAASLMSVDLTGEMFQDLQILEMATINEMVNNGPG